MCLLNSYHMLVLKQMVWTTSEEDLKNNHITKSIEYMFYLYTAKHKIIATTWN